MITTYGDLKIPNSLASLDLNELPQEGQVTKLKLSNWFIAEINQAPGIAELLIL